MANNRARYEEALNRGHSYSWDQRWQEAIQAFEIAANEEAAEPAPYAGLGMAYLELDNLEKALENYKLAAKYSKGEVIYLRQVADVQERLGLFDEAGKTYMAIGEIELTHNHLDEAMNNWHLAIRLEPDLLRAHQRLASVYQRQGAVRNAIQEYLAIARILQGQGQKEKALQACQLALQLDPRNPDILTAIELVKQGEPIFSDTQTKGKAKPKRSSGLLQHVSQATAKDAKNWKPDTQVVETVAPVEEAKQTAMEELAVGLFGDDDSDETLTPAVLERGHLISQALDYQRRGMVNE
ncbi:MAG: hypothetical protein IAF02_06320, partial [Anaerolineae bacterium]|nr:hypothetical protein [Anaerolineae bacterium]